MLDISTEDWETIRRKTSKGLNLVVNHDDKEDIIQEAMIRLYQHGNINNNPAACAITIAKRVGIDKWRKNQTRKTLSLDAPNYDSDPTDPVSFGECIPDTKPTPYEEVLSKDSISKYLGMLDSIKDFYGVHLLEFAQGLSLIQIAELHEISIGTVRSRMSRGRKLLKKLLSN